MAERKNGQQAAVDSLIAQLELGCVPWRKPWTSRMPRNLVSQKVYRGMNVFMLALQGYSSEYWLTFKQANDLCGTVMKGQHGTHITKFSTYNRKDKRTDEASGEEVESTSRASFWHTYTVFNLQQCNPELGAALGLTNTEPIEDIPAAQALWDGYQNRPELRWSDCAFYRPSEDIIGMPARERFVSAQAEFYSTLFHEMVHSTGALKRLSREGITNGDGFNGEKYSAEELIAEFGAAMLCGSCGIAPALVENQAAYIKHWLTKLKLSDNKLVIPKAMSAAQKAVDHILGVAQVAPAVEEQATQEEVAVCA
jgi:antirestriction protein ArdC